MPKRLPKSPRLRKSGGRPHFWRWLVLVPKLLFGNPLLETPFRETEFPGRAFPNGVWERGESAGDKSMRPFLDLVGPAGRDHALAHDPANPETQDHDDG